MYKNLTFLNKKSRHKIDKCIQHNFELQPVLRNKRTHIFRNSIFSISVDRKITRVLIYEQHNFELEKKLQEILG